MPAVAPYTTGAGGYGGGGPFGTRVAPIPTPDPFADLSRIYPNLSATNTAVSGAIRSKLAGQLAPETLMGLQDDAARYGITSGSPGMQPGGIASNYALYHGALARENLQQQGIQDYNQTIPTVSGTQTVSPGLQTQISATNAVNASAPDPTAAASYAQSLFDKYLQLMRGPGGGTGSSGWQNQTRLFGPPEMPQGTQHFAAGPGGALAPQFRDPGPQVGGGPLGADPSLSVAPPWTPPWGTPSPGGGTGYSYFGSNPDDVLNSLFNPDEYAYPTDRLRYPGDGG
jgi:hypothetical protein